MMKDDCKVMRRLLRPRRGCSAHWTVFGYGGGGAVFNAHSFQQLPASSFQLPASSRKSECENESEGKGKNESEFRGRLGKDLAETVGVAVESGGQYTPDSLEV